MILNETSLLQDIRQAEKQITLKQTISHNQSKKNSLKRLEREHFLNHIKKRM